MSFTERSPALVHPPVGRASRWRDTVTANRVTTQVLRDHEARLRRSLLLREPFVEVRSPVAPDVGTVFVREDGDVVERPVTSAVVRLDLSGPAPVLLASAPDVVDTADGSWDLLQVLTRCVEDGHEWWDDPRVAVDAALAADPDRAGRALAQWRDLVGREPSEASVRNVVRAVAGPSSSPPVEGDSWTTWAGWFEEHLAGVAAGRVQVAPAATGCSSPVRTGEFDAGIPLDDVVQAVLHRNAEALAPWAADADGTRRTVVRADVGRTVGTVLTRGPDLAVDSTVVAVVLQRNGTGGWNVLDAHPDLAVSAALRDAHPVAAALLPAYLGPGTPRLEVLPWPAQRALLVDEPDHVLAAFRAELEGLLAQDDDRLRRVLLDLGAVVVPHDVRAWVSRWTWRSRRFGWSR